MPVYTTSEANFAKIRQKLIKRMFISAPVILIYLGWSWENFSHREINFFIIIELFKATRTSFMMKYFGLESPNFQKRQKRKCREKSNCH